MSNALGNEERAFLIVTYV